MRLPNLSQRTAFGADRNDAQETDRLVCRVEQGRAIVRNEHLEQEDSIVISTEHHKINNRGTPDFPTSLFLHRTQLRHTLSRRLCPSWLVISCSTVLRNAHDRMTCTSQDVSQLLYIGKWKRFFCAGAVVNNCHSILSSLRSLCRNGRGLLSSSSLGAGTQGTHHRSSFCRSRRYRTARCFLGFVLIFTFTWLLLLLWVYATLMQDPYAEMRVHLRAAYAQKNVEDVVRALRSRDGVDSHPALLTLSSQHTTFTQALLSVVDPIRASCEEWTLSLLALVFAHLDADAVRSAQVWMASLLREIHAPVFLMIGEVPMSRSNDIYNKDDNHYHNTLFRVSNHAGITANITGGATVGERLFDVVRSAALRCTYGFPTLVRHENESPLSRTDVFDSLWSTFVNGDAVTVARPQCLLRFQPRMPCADVGVVSATTVAAAAADGVAVNQLTDRKNWVQHLYERKRLRLNTSAVASLYYDFTPGLPAEAYAWRTGKRAASVSKAKVSNSAVRQGVRLQAERFLRTATNSGSNTSSFGAARTFSGVILLLSGAADRNPEGRELDFVQHALPLLEENLLRNYPHYPVHVFYTRTSAQERVNRTRPAWSLRDVLRHSDVYTIPHSWRSSDATPPINSNPHNSNEHFVHIPPPPPILVESLHRLREMRAQHTEQLSWFRTVAARVPSAPYVTFENVAPLFSTLPCGVTESDVTAWANDPTVYLNHRRGYRQMCRFWARLVWRLPSLRVWTASTEGRKEMATYAAVRRSTSNRIGAGSNPYESQLMPPWRYRYTYYFRLDTDSFLRRPVACDPFAVMSAKRCAYGYNSLRFDIVNVTRHLGAAMAEWMERCAGSIGGAKVASEPSKVHSTRYSADESDLDWGRLSDPSLVSMVTLLSSDNAEAGNQNGTESAQGLLPPLPPTWPWPNVYPAHSSQALSTAETQMLRALFFTDVRTLWEDQKRNLPRARRFPPPPVTGNTAAAAAAVKEAMLMEHLPSTYANQRTYNRLMYYNNFELGTFALKNHPLYTSVVDFFDNHDYDVVMDGEHEVAVLGYTLVALQEISRSISVSNSSLLNYTNPAFFLQPSGDAETLATTSVVFPHTGAAQPRERCRGPTQHRQRGEYGTKVHNGDGFDGDRPRGNEAGTASQDDWRSGFLQYRWGDAPVHTFGVEVVLQREGWGVCAFTEDFGGYEHGRYQPR